MRWGDGVWCYSCCPRCPKAPWSGIKQRDSSAKKDQPWRIVCCSDASCQVWPSFVTWPEEKRRRKTWADNLVPHYSTPGLQTLYYWPIEMSQLADKLGQPYRTHIFENHSKILFGNIATEVGKVYSEINVKIFCKYSLCRFIFKHCA